MPPEPTHSRLERRCAQAILKAFKEYQRKFKMITQRAKARFEYQDWQGMKGDAAERLDLYREHVSLIAIEINKLLAESVSDKKIWTKTKVIYSDLNSNEILGLGLRIRALDRLTLAFLGDSSENRIQKIMFLLSRGLIKSSFHQINQKAIVLELY